MRTRSHGASRSCSRAPLLLATALLLGTTLPACTPGQTLLSREAHTAREKLVGLSRADVLRCAGEPHRVQHADKWEYLSYLSREPMPESRHTRCVTTFTLRNGYVESVDYENPNGNLIGTSIPECLDTVKPCLAEVK